MILWCNYEEMQAVRFGAEAVLSSEPESACAVAAPPAVREDLEQLLATLEGDLGAIFALVQRMQEAVFTQGARRISTVLKIDERRDRAVRMEDKVAEIESRAQAEAELSRDSSDLEREFMALEADSEVEAELALLKQRQMDKGD